MKGYGMLEINKPGWIEKEKPVAGSFDVIIRPIAVAICSSDTHTLHGGGGDFRNRILGHESVGEVVEVGSGVKNFKPGNKVCVNCVTPDWESFGVQDRNGNNGHDHSFMESFKFLFQKDGVFAEYYHVNNADANLAYLPEGVSIEDALMTTDMMSTAFYGVENADVQFGDSVVVFGIGPVGLMAVAAAAIGGAGRIIAIGSRRIERMLNLIKAGRVHPGKMLNYKFEGIEKIEEAFKVMDEKPSDLIKPYVIF